MPIPVTRACGPALKTTDEAAGKTLRCPKGPAAVTLPSPIAQLPPVRPGSALAQRREVIGAEIEVIQQVAPLTPHGQCPYCGGRVLAGARKCKHCGETIDVALRPADAARQEVRRLRLEGPSRGRDVQMSRTTVVVNTPERERPFPHLPHLTLTILTCGWWLPVSVLHLILAPRGGDSFVAWLTGIPLCLGLLACAGVVAFMGIGTLASPSEKTGSAIVAAPKAGHKSSSGANDRVTNAAKETDAQACKEAVGKATKTAPPKEELTKATVDDMPFLLLSLPRAVFSAVWCAVVRPKT